MDTNEDTALSNYEALNSPPSWVVANGMKLMLAIVLMLIIVGSIIKYPDIVRATFTLTSELPPQKVIAKTPGNIRLLVRNGMTVKKGNIVAYIDNPAELSDVLALKEHINRIAALLEKEDSSTDISAIINRELGERPLRIGEIREKYNMFINNINKLRVRYIYSAAGSQVNSLEKEISYQKKINQLLSEQRNVAEREYYFSQKQYTIDSTLFTQKVTSQADFNNASKVILGYVKNIEQINSSIIQNEITINQLEREISVIRLNQHEEYSTLRNDIFSSITALTAAIDGWEDRICFRSKYDGIVSFSRVITDREYITSGEDILNIIPDTDNIYGAAVINANSIGKVRVGQRVRIELNGYPRNEFGFVNGIVETISLVPVNNSYHIVIKLPHGLANNTHKIIEYKPELSGNAEIITADVKFLERLLYQFKDLAFN